MTCDFRSFKQEVSEKLPQVSSLAPHPHVYLSEDPYQLQKEKEARLMENLTNPNEDHFNESLLILLNVQQDFQKQSFNMIQDMKCRHEYDNLMRDIPKYDGKSMDWAEWLLQIEKIASLTHRQEYELATARSASTHVQNVEKIR